MAENKFIERLRGESTAQAVLEIQDKKSVTSFANMPAGTSNANTVYSDARNNATSVLKGAINWKINGATLTLSDVNGDGTDYTGSSQVSGVSDQQGNNLWLNAVYTVGADGMYLTKNTKWILKLCGSNLIVNGGHNVEFTIMLSIGSQNLITKKFVLAEQANQFCKEMVIDFAESNATAIKLEQGDTITLWLLCDIANASARIYEGMSTLTLLQRRVDSDAVSSNTRTFDDLEEAFDDVEEAVDDLVEDIDKKVNIDGTSIMTGPLKFRAGSFEGAIAGGLGDGISIYKLKADGSIDLEVASLTKTNGFVPGTNNTMDIGRNNFKWKDAYVARVITSVLNNGFDIAVPVTNQAETLALKSEVDLAANSGRMITGEGVWYAKMAAAGTIPAEAAVEGRNYADFTQVDGSGNPIIVIYTYTSGLWTQTETITPPAEYDGYVPVTSKIWDIAEQAGQQGGRILWNHQSKEFTPYPMIISFENIDVTGESTVAMPATPVPGQIVNKQYVDNLLGSAFANRDLSNLTSTGANISNWSHNVSNCVSESPQDIKLELSNGTLTLKAGSKVYVPNGAGVFNTITIANDISISGASTSPGAVRMLYYVGNNAISVFIGHSSGTTPPTSGTNQVFYNESDNTIKRYTNGSVVASGYSFPLAMIKDDGTYLCGSIEQVFNGIGYIGSHVFFLPDYSVLTPNGRNADGTLASRKYTFTSCTVYTRNLTQSNVPLWVRYNGQITFSTGIGYDPITNQSGGNSGYAQVATATLTGGVISGFVPKQVFHAVDYNDLTNLLETIYPVGSVYIGTQNTCPMSVAMPGTTWTLVSSGKALWTGNGTNGNTTIAAGLPNITGQVSVTRGDNYGWRVMNTDGAFSGKVTSINGVTNSTTYVNTSAASQDNTIDLNASSSNSIYGNSNTVQPPAYVVNVWRRTA